jgi:hypothetical protein
MAQTSVEWLVEQINGKSLNNVTIDIPKDLIDQAKEMHKRETKTAFNEGNLSAYNSNKIQSAENYYNETFNQ